MKPDGRPTFRGYVLSESGEGKKVAAYELKEELREGAAGPDDLPRLFCWSWNPKRNVAGAIHLSAPEKVGATA